MSANRREPEAMPCPECNYDLRASQPLVGSRIITCPECGSPCNADLLWLDKRLPRTISLWLGAILPAIFVATISLLAPKAFSDLGFLLYATILLGGLPLIAIAFGHALIIHLRGKAAFLECGIASAPFWPTLIAFGSDMAAMILIGRVILAGMPRC